MEQLHLLVDREPRSTLRMGLTEKILCRQCMYTWWTQEEDLDREIECIRCGHRARVEKDKRKVLE